MPKLFSTYAPAEVAEVYIGLCNKGHYKLAQYLSANYEDSAPTADHFNSFIRTIHDRTCGSNTLF